MKKALIVSTAMAFAVVSVVAPAVSAQSAAQELAHREAMKKKAFDTCVTRINIVKNAPAELERIKEAHFVKPSDMSAYPKKDGVVLSGKTTKVKDGGGIQTSVATKGPNKNKTNYAIILDRFQGAASVAADAVYSKNVNGHKKGDRVVTVGEFQEKNKDLSEQLKTWSTIIDATAKTYQEGHTYKAGENIGSGVLASTESDRNKNAKMISKNTFTVSYNTEQCKTSAGRKNMELMSKRRALMLRAVKGGVKQTKEIKNKAQDEYGKIQTRIKDVGSRNVEYR